MICADPQATCEVWLKSDAATPKETRPTFLVRALTEQESGEANRKLEEALTSAASDADVSALVHQAIAVGLTGWRNVSLRGEPVPYSPDTKAGSFLQSKELWELAGLVSRGTGLTEQEVKN